MGDVCGDSLHPWGVLIIHNTILPILAVFSPNLHKTLTFLVREEIVNQKESTRTLPLGAFGILLSSLP
jgi:hypothetical protein